MGPFVGDVASLKKSIFQYAVDSSSMKKNILPEWSDQIEKCQSAWIAFAHVGWQTFSQIPTAVHFEISFIPQAFYRNSIIIQRGNAVAILGSLPRKVYFIPKPNIVGVLFMSYFITSVLTRASASDSDRK